MQAAKVDTQAQRTKERNRIYAARTRQRKTQQAQQLRQRCAHLEAENAHLRTQVQQLQAENTRLRASAYSAAAAGTQAQSAGSAASDSSALAHPHSEPAAPAAPRPGGAPAAQNSCVRAAANTARFTAAAVGSQKLPPPVSGAAAFKAAQEVGAAPQSVPPQPRAAMAVAESCGVDSGAPATSGRGRRVKRGRGESLAVTLDDIGAKRSRGMVCHEIRISLIERPVTCRSERIPVPASSWFLV